MRQAIRLPRRGKIPLWAMRGQREVSSRGRREKSTESKGSLRQDEKRLFRCRTVGEILKLRHPPSPHSLHIPPLPPSGRLIPIQRSCPPSPLSDRWIFTAKVVAWEDALSASSVCSRSLARDLLKHKITKRLHRRKCEVQYLEREIVA